MLQKNFFLRTAFLLLSFVFIISIPAMSETGTYNIIPYPQQLVPQQGKFVINEKTVVVYAGQNAEVRRLVSQFSDQVQLVSGVKMLQKANATADTENVIEFNQVSDLKSNPEAYTLTISGKKIVVQSATANGFFYALQTLYQLLPAEIYGKKRVDAKEWSAPAVSIADAPRFAYRGLHLDVCRHFFPIEFIKKYIDAMAIHKMNSFHWHLTDDQGWRIDIKKYPLLTKVGSRRVETLVGYYFENYPQRFDDDAYSGFYTQDEAREIVKYAAERYITVIPEIEMPGHAVAAIASYPYLSCTRAPIKVATKWGIFKDVYCTRDSTFAFLENVLTEIMDIFPGKYIHIGGDECPKDRWKACPDCQARMKAENLKDENELQSYFVHRIEKFLNAHNRQIIGWDEILDGGLAPNATVMSWRGYNGGIAAAKAGHDVIMTPTSFCYFDQYQSDPMTEPTTIGGFIPLQRAYNFEPVPAGLDSVQAKHILGAQANLWSEYMPNTERVEYMAFPRVSAMSEALWTENANRNWNRFRSNMITEYKRYAEQNIHASKVFFDVQFRASTSADRKVVVSLEADNPNAEIRYTIDGSTPTAASNIYIAPLRLSESATVKAVAVENGKVTGKEFSKSFIVSKATGLSYTQNPMNTWYRGDNQYSLTDGLTGNTKSISQWVSVGGSKDGEFVVDLQKTQNIHRFSVGLLNAPAFCGMYPAEIKVFTSLDGVDYKEVASEHINPRAAGAWEIYRPELIFPLTAARYVKLLLLNAGSCTNLDSNASQMFLDEIGVW